jgi:phosphoglycerate dehydrogenase-like enzyme
MYLLILDFSAEDYKKALQPKFPDLSIFTSTSEDEIGDVIEKAEVLFATRVSDSLIRKASNLKWIQAKTAGVDALVNLPSLRKDVLLTSMRGIHGPQMSEMAILLMLALNRDLPRVIRNQDQGIWERWPGRLLSQKNVGILGVGAIGEAIAQKCKAFGMRVYGIDILKRKIKAIDSFHGPEELLQILPEIDYLIIVAPLTPQTHRLIGIEALSVMKSSAFLINIGRGEIVDEEALIDALKRGKIAGAALDAFSTEPLPKGHPFWTMENVIVTPHVGGLSDIYVEQALPIFEENLQRFLRGERETLINRVDR